jgi:5-methyltetrahydropteroyltriglutamate--homocysteine methyltransferase
MTLARVSASQPRRIMKLRGHEVLLPATHVGSYPRPVYLQGKVFEVGVDAPDYRGFHTRELYHAAVAAAVRDQERAGLDIVTDGGQHYENETNYELAELFHFLPHRLAGYRPFGDRIQVGQYDMPIWKPTIVDRIEWRRPVYKPVVEAVQEATDLPMKINIGMGPVSMAILSTDRHYHDLPAVAMDLAAAYNEELSDLAARGVDQIQYSEPLPILFALLEPADWMIDVINRSLAGVDLYRVVHMCYGHEEGQAAIPDSGAMGEKIFPWAFGVDCDQLHLEMASHEFTDTKALSNWPADKDLGIGVVDVKDMRVERPETIAGWIRQTIAVVPPERVCVSSDCSVASLRRVVAARKLRAIADGARIVRAELTGTS